MSKMAWLQRIRVHLIDGGPSKIDKSQQKVACYFGGTKELNYFMDECNLLAIDEDLVDEQTWPPPDVFIIRLISASASVQQFVPDILMVQIGRKS